MAYATVSDVQARLTRTLTTEEQAVCGTLLDDAAVLIDSYRTESGEDVKNMVSCRMVIRALGDDTNSGFPVGATQGSMAGLGYSQSWTLSGGSAGELYLSKAEKQMLGIGRRIGSKSPVEDLTAGVIKCW